MWINFPAQFYERDHAIYIQVEKGAKHISLNAVPATHHKT